MNPLQASRRRRALLARSLLGSNDTVDAVLELEGTTSAAALSINSNLATNVVNGALQVGGTDWALPATAEVAQRNH